jgi:hypothetical protein
MATHAPTADDEVTLSSPLVAAADVQLGEQVRIEPLGQVTIVGAVRDPGWLSAEDALVQRGRSPRSLERRRSC